MVYYWLIVTPPKLNPGTARVAFKKAHNLQIHPL